MQQENQEVSDYTYTYYSSSDEEPSRQVGKDVAAIYTITKEDAFKEARLCTALTVPAKLRASTFRWQNRLPFARVQDREWLRDNAGELHEITASQIASLAVLLDGLRASDLPMHLEAARMHLSEFASQAMSQKSLAQLVIDEGKLKKSQHDAQTDQEKRRLDQAERAQRRLQAQRDTSGAGNTPIKEGSLRAMDTRGDIAPAAAGADEACGTR